MYRLLLLCASLYISLPHTCVCQAEGDPFPFGRIIQRYFQTESLRRLRKEWETVRKPFEHALVTFMNDNIGSPGMNVYIKNRREKRLGGGYFHDDNQVRVIFKDLNLEAIPFCLRPDVKFTLASNVLKVDTILSKMIIHADYVLIRNKSDIIHDPKDQDPFESSPFLFEQVHDVGKVAITMEDCELKGFITLEINIDEIDFRHDRFKMFNCVYTIEIYRPGDESPPVIARYNMSNYHRGLGLTDLLKEPLLTNSLIPKLQSSIYSFVNTSAIFGSKISEYRDNQDIVLLLTANKLAEVVRKMNKLTVEKNHGAIEMADYEVHWNDGRIKPSNKNKVGTGESLRLTHLVLTGLDTLYSAHKGGPFELDTVRIAEKLRFSSLQVRGKLEIISTWSDVFDFAAEMSDLTVDLHIELSESKNNSKTDTWIKDRKLEVEGISHMTFTVPTLIFGSAESLIGGYLLKEVPKLINAHSVAMFDQAMLECSKTKPPTQVALNAEGSKVDDSIKVEGDFSYSVDDQMAEEINGVRERDTLKKNKKHFKSPNHPRSHGHTYGKRLAKN